MKNTRDAQQLRIIGGSWRGRKIGFPDRPGLRPTPDRVRETLFNWLAPVIEGAHCLDLFAGSGALGFEALSRGADFVVMVESDPLVLQGLQNNCELLEAKKTTLVQANGLEYLAQSSAAFDIIFLDPPFRDNLMNTCCEQLEQRGWLKPTAYIYMESDKGDDQPVLPANWTLHRNKVAGQVAYSLAIRNSAHP